MPARLTDRGPRSRRRRAVSSRHLLRAYAERHGSGLAMLAAPATPDGGTPSPSRWSGSSSRQPAARSSTWSWMPAPRWTSGRRRSCARRRCRVRGDAGDRGAQGGARASASYLSASGVELAKTSFVLNHDLRPRNAAPEGDRERDRGEDRAEHAVRRVPLPQERQRGRAGGHRGAPDSAPPEQLGRLAAQLAGSGAPDRPRSATRRRLGGLFGAADTCRAGRGSVAVRAGGGSRTLTPSRAADFKSAASAVPPLRRGAAYRRRWWPRRRDSDCRRPPRTGATSDHRRADQDDVLMMYSALAPTGQRREDSWRSRVVHRTSGVDVLSIVDDEQQDRRRAGIGRRAAPGRSRLPGGQDGQVEGASPTMPPVSCPDRREAAERPPRGSTGTALAAARPE